MRNGGWAGCLSEADDDDTVAEDSCGDDRKSRVINRAGCSCALVALVVADVDERSPQAHGFEEDEEEVRRRV